MKFKIMFLGLMLSVPFLGNAMDFEKIKMPTEDVLRKRLVDAGLVSFAQSSHFLKSFAEKEFMPTGIAMAIDLACYDFVERLRGSAPADMLFCAAKKTIIINRPLFFEVLLEGHPKTLEWFEKVGIYNPIGKD